VAKRLMHISLGYVSDDGFADLCRTRRAVHLQRRMYGILHLLAYASA
jgi:hypothetical protein